MPLYYKSSVVSKSSWLIKVYEKDDSLTIRCTFLGTNFIGSVLPIALDERLNQTVVDNHANSTARVSGWGTLSDSTFCFK